MYKKTHKVIIYHPRENSISMPIMKVFKNKHRANINKISIHGTSKVVGNTDWYGRGKTKIRYRSI